MKADGVHMPTPFGKYYLLERINVGGMAEVFRAKAYGVEGFERLVALKRILPNLSQDGEFIRMFVDEAKIAVQLTHANIAQISDLGVVDGAYYIALEHVYGRDLRAIFTRCANRGEPMPVAQACYCIMKVCEGLDYAHNKRDESGAPLYLVHRDVSPQNILVSFEGEVKLIDFGVAKAAGKRSKTQAGVLKGKFGYMSPEQVRGLPIDRRSDIFSCGIVLYELLTGERLFAGESDFSTLEKVRNVEILPPSTYNRKISPALEGVVLKALSQDLEERYQHAIELHDDLQAFVQQSGAFCSRKDLAAWMKELFAKEIERESAKLETYQRLHPPKSPAQASSGPSRGPGSVTAPPPSPSSAPRFLPLAAPSPREPAAKLAWDEDELVTELYSPPPSAAVAAPRAPAPAKGAVLATPRPVLADNADMESSSSWSRPPVAASPQELGADGSPPKTTPSGLNRVPLASQPIPVVAERSEQSFATLWPSAIEEPATVRPLRRWLDVGRLLRSSRVHVVVGALLSLFGVAAIASTLYLRGRSASHSGTKATAATVHGRAALSHEVLMNTGFDLFVSPMSIRDHLEIRLDGTLHAMAPPMRFRYLLPGDHLLEVTAPPGYQSRREIVRIAAGKAGRVTLLIRAASVAVTFRSEPPGAEVLLFSQGVETLLGRATKTVELDSSKSYEVVLQKKGYAPFREAIKFSGADTETVFAVLEPALPERRAVSNRPPAPPPGPAPAEAEPPKPSSLTQAIAQVAAPPGEAAAESVSTVGVNAGKTGTIGLSSKPPCRIFVDGRDTGLLTPQRELVLSVGSHTITLVNQDYNLRDSFAVDIKPGENPAVLRNLMASIETSSTP